MAQPDRKPNQTEINEPGTTDRFEIDREQPRAKPRTTGVDPAEVGLMAVVIALFAVLVTLLLQPDQFAQRLLALALGVGSAAMVLVFSPRRKGRSPAAAPSTDRGLRADIEQQAWTLQELNRTNRQLGEELRSLRTRLDDTDRNVRDLYVRRPRASAG